MHPGVKLETPVARAESSQGLGIMPAYRGGDRSPARITPTALRDPDQQAFGGSSDCSTVVLRVKSRLHAVDLDASRRPGSWVKRVLRQ